MRRRNLVLKLFLSFRVAGEVVPDTAKRNGEDVGSRCSEHVLATGQLLQGSAPLSLQVDEYSTDDISQDDFVRTLS